MECRPHLHTCTYLYYISPCTIREANPSAGSLMFHDTSLRDLRSPRASKELPSVPFCCTLASAFLECMSHVRCPICDSLKNVRPSERNDVKRTRGDGWLVALKPLAHGSLLASLCCRRGEKSFVDVLNRHFHHGILNRQVFRK